MKATVALLAFTLFAATDAGARRLELRFVPEGQGPVLFVLLQDEEEPSGRGRTASWVLFAGGTATSGTISDEPLTEGRSPFRELPEPPAGLGLLAEGDGALLLTLTGLGDWQSQAHGLMPVPDGGTSPAVASGQSARLLVEAAEGPLQDLEESYTSAAALYGTKGVVTGRVVVDRRTAPSGTTSLLANLGGALLTLDPARPPGGARVFVADARRACERVVPSAVVLELPTAPPARLFASATGGCLPDGRVVLPFEGSELQAREEAPARGLLVVEPELPRG